MPFEGYYYIGKVVRLYSYKGEVYIRLYVNNPEEYLEMESMFLNIQDNLVPFFVESIQFGSKGMLRVKFEDIDTEIDAKSLLKKDIYAPNSFLPSEESEIREDDILGFTVIDSKKGEIGEVEELISYPTNTLILIEQGEKDILIPFQDAFIQKIDSEKKIIQVNLPDGLLEIND